MKAVGRLVLILVIVFSGWYFVHTWNETTPEAAGTGSIGGNDAGLASNAATTQPNDLVSQIASDPKKYEGKTETLSGRVHGFTKYASNRYMYSLQSGSNRVLVVDDQSEAPKLDWNRTATGVVHVLGAPIGPKYAYLYAVKSSAAYEAPSWTAIAHFFTDKADEMKKGADGASMAGEQQINEINAMLVSYGYHIAFTADPTNRGYSCAIIKDGNQIAFYPFGGTKWDALIGAMGRLLEGLERRPR